MGFKIYGAETSGFDFAVIDIMLVPCTSRITLHDGREIGGTDDCIWDKQEVFDYMGRAYNFVSYFNQMTVDENEYDEDTRIKRKSVVNSAFCAT